MVSPKLAALAPRVHVFVCANRREATSPLGPGCGDAGAAVFAALKEGVARRGAYRSIWITETRCLGLCPRHGAAVAVYPRQALLVDVVAADAEAVLEAAIASELDR